jgi:hypothetical protein
MKIGNRLRIDNETAFIIVLSLSVIACIFIGKC